EWGNEGVMSRAEREGLPYLFRLRATANVKRALERAMAERDWSDAGQGWQGKETNLRLLGWSRQRSAGASRFSVPACAYWVRRARGWSRLTEGHRRRRLGLDHHEHGATIGYRRAWLPC